MLRYILYLWLAVTLTACSTPPAGAGDAQPQAAATATPQPAAVPDTPTPPPTPTATAMPAVIFPTVPFEPECAERRGRVANFNYHAYTLGYSLFYDVYLPPCYDESGQEYPVLYLMHGQAFIEDQWDRLGADEAADALIAAGEVGPFIMIMPRGGANPYFGQGLMNDLIPFVEATYRIQGDRANRAIGGLSRGGGWALFLGLSHPDMFSTIGAHSPAVQYIHAPEMDNLLDALEPDQVPRLWLDIGDTDSLIYNTEWFTAMLDERDINYTYHVYPGKHEEAYWSAHVQDYILFYAEAW